MVRLQSRSAYRVFEIVQDIRELAEALGHPKFVLVAHDWGAVAAWQFAAYHQVWVLLRALVGLLSSEAGQPSKVLLSGGILVSCSSKTANPFRTQWQYCAATEASDAPRHQQHCCLVCRML